MKFITNNICEFEILNNISNKVVSIDIPSTIALKENGFYIYLIN